MISSMRIETPTAQLLHEAATMATTSGIGMTSAEIETEIGAGRLRPQWSQVAIDDAGQVIGRALWWGRDQQTPLALDVWDVMAGHTEAAKVLRALLKRGHAVLAARGIPVPLPHTLRVPVAWREDAAVAHEVHTKIVEATGMGLGHHNERRQFEWKQVTPVIPPSSRLRFEPADDDTFISLFARVMPGSLDVMTRRELATTDALSLARDEVDYYRS